MATITFSNGTKINFEGSPSTSDIHEIAHQIGIVDVPPETPASPKPGLLDRASNLLTSVFPGTKTIGKAIGTALVSAKEYAKGKPDIANNIGKSGPSIPQQLGAYGEAGATALGVAAPLPKAATVLGAAGKAALQTGALSAVQGAGAAAENGGAPEDVAKSAFLSGLTGAAIGGLAGAATKVVQGLTDKAPTALYNNALRVTARIKEAGKSPAAFLADEGTWGSLGHISNAAQKGMAAEDAAINQAAVHTPGGITWDAVKSKAAESLSREFGDLYNPKQIDALIESVPLSRLQDAKDTVPWVDANGARSALGGLIGDTKWLQSNPTGNTKAAQAVYGALSDAIKDATGTTDQFARYSQWIRTKKAVTRAVALADAKYGVGLYDILSGVGGATYGGLSGGDPLERLKNAVIGGTGAVAAERTINSSTVKTGIAQLLQHINALPTDATGRVSRDAVTAILGQLIGGGTTPQNQ